MSSWVTQRGPSGQTLTVRRCRLEVTEGPDAGRWCAIDAAPVRVGARAADLALTDPLVSAVHVELSAEPEGHRVRDLGSTNGTWVAGCRLLDAVVPPWTPIRVGATTLRAVPLDEVVDVPLYAGDRFGQLLGRSIPMRRLFAALARLARSSATVLVEGETGVGKELVADALHAASARAPGPFVVLDCGAIPDALVEDELFGHERGAFTGAHATTRGVFERAHGGTLFIDEIGELPLPVQPKLLRAVETGTVRRVGGEQALACDVRIVAATNRELGAEVQAGRFREDLYYRLAVAGVRVPPLRERREDIPLLVEHFRDLLPGGRSTSLPDGFVEALEARAWPGNVRELRNAVERALVAPDLPPEPELGEPAAWSFPVDPDVPFKAAKKRLMDEFDRRYLGALLERHGGNLAAAARASGIERMSIYKALDRLGLPRGRGVNRG